MSKSLLPPNSSGLEHHLKAATARMAEPPVPLRDLWNPWRCPAELLPWLAWSLSIDEWSSDWPEQIQRRIIAESVQVHRQKGSRAAVERALNALGARVELKEWFEDGLDAAEQAHTFTLTALAHEALAPQSEAILDETFFNAVRTSIDSTKPVRSHYQLRVGAKYATGLKAATALQGLNFRRERAKAEVRPIKRRLNQALATAAQACGVLRLTMTAQGGAGA